MLYAALSNIVWVWTESDCLAGIWVWRAGSGGQYVKMTHETEAIVHLLGRQRLH